MKIQTLIVATVLALLTGCASLDKSITCTETNHQLLIEENARLVENEKELKEYQAGKKIPGENFTLFPSREALLQALIANYNQRYDSLVYNANHYNELCVRK